MSDEMKERLHSILKDRLVRLWAEHAFAKHFANILSIENRVTIAEDSIREWDELLGSLGIKTSDTPSDEGIVIRDPARQERFISVPKEVAEKILMLGGLP